MLLSEIHRQIQHATKIVDDFVDFAHQNSAMVNRDLNFFGLGVFGSGEIFQTEPQIIWSIVGRDDDSVHQLYTVSFRPSAKVKRGDHPAVRILESSSA